MTHHKEISFEDDRGRSMTGFSVQAIESPWSPELTGLAVIRRAAA